MPSKCTLAAGVAVLATLVTFASASDRVYKSIGPDGQVVYSQTPPSEGRVEKQLSYEHLPATPLPAYVLKFRAEMERSIQRKQMPASTPDGSLQLYSARWCGYCRMAQAWLASQKIAYTNLDIDTPQGMSAYVQASGSKVSVPLLTGPGVRVQGFSEQAYRAALARTPRQP